MRIFTNLAKYVKEQLENCTEVQKDEVMKNDLFLKGRYFTLKEIQKRINKLKKNRKA